ncbi:MAG: folate-binding protein YgfZ [Gammaproteobacteria bacterium]|nr:folate-binding protein YgfZ [Gammaproteobacteria bacterium]
MDPTAIRWMDHLSEPRPQPGADAALAGASAAEEAALLSKRDLLMALPQLGLLAAEGADTASFLQGQLSCDLRQLTAGHALLGGHSSPKGRLLAVLLLQRAGDAVWLELPAALAANLCKRLSMYVLRAKVRLRDAGAERPAIGLIGARAGAILEAIGLPAPAAPLAVASADGTSVLRRHGEPARYSLRAEPQRLAQLWPLLAARAQAVGPAVWRLAEIRAGVPTVLPPTQEHFVAQMVNLDLLGGVSYDKGCYTGQEVIARLHYRGNLKRRMFLARAAAPAIAPGTAVFDAGGSDTQPVGEVVDAAPMGGGSALLVVLQLGHRDSSPLRLGAADGAPLVLCDPADLDL